MPDHGIFTDVTPSVTNDGGYTGRPPDYPPISYDAVIDGNKFSLLTGKYKDEWAPNTVYEPGDMVAESEDVRNLLLCLEYHTSETSIDMTKFAYLFNLGFFESSVIPPGGSAGQILEKSSAADYDFIWGDKAVGVPEAPNDGNAWVRQSTAWAQLTTFGVGEAPIDGTEYVRKDGGWVSNSGGSGFLTDAPTDGNPYARLDGAWAQTPTLIHGHASTEVTFDNAVSGLSAATVKAALDELAAMHTNLAALDVEYDNASSGLSAITVQAAIDEIDASLDTHKSMFHITEAPLDSQNYVRNNGAWAILSQMASLVQSSTAPVSPMPGLLWQDTTTMNVYIWYEDGTSNQWVLIGGGGGVLGASLFLQDTPPVTPVHGTIWLNSTTFKAKVWFEDGSSSQWVDVGTAGGLTDAAADGLLYGRQDSDWVQAVGVDLASNILTGQLKLAIVDAVPSPSDPLTLYFIKQP